MIGVNFVKMHSLLIGAILNLWISVFEDNIPISLVSRLV
jgi:hypothetical protein